MVHSDGQPSALLQDSLHDANHGNSALTTGVAGDYKMAPESQYKIQKVAVRKQKKTQEAKHESAI